MVATSVGVESSAIFVTADGRQRVVVVAMKTQLRGRIRRTVTTLLDQGAEVTVLGLRSDKDFAVGLDHPELTIELLEPSSIYLAVVRRQQRAAANRQRRREALARSIPILIGKRVSHRLLLGCHRAAGQLRSILRRLFRGLKRAFKIARKCVAGIDCGARGLRTVLGKTIRGSFGVAKIALVRAAKRLPRRSDSLLLDELDSDESQEPPELPEVPSVAHIELRIRAWLATSLKVSRDGPVTARLLRLFAVAFRGARALRRYAQIRARRIRRFVRRRRLHLRRFVVRGRRGFRRRRRQLSRWRLRRRRRRRNRAQERRKKRMLSVRSRVLPWHRITRWVAFWRISRRRALDLRPDFVVSSDLPGLVGASLAARALGVPHAHDCHELYLESTSLRDIERRLLAPIERRYMRRADAIVIVNESIRREYAERYGVEGTVIRNCAEQGDMQSGQDLYGLTGQLPDAQLVLYQGGLSVGRGLEVVVEAVAGFPDNAHLVMMGYGPLEQELRELSKAHEVEERVSFVAAVSPEQLLSTTASATVGLVPYQPVSVNNRLALPNKIFEYTAVGLPVVVSAIPELTRIADQGVGLTYDPFDPADLARAVSTLLSPGVLEEAEVSSREWGRSNTWELEQQKLIEVWKQLLPTDLVRGL